jgi:hypothetical protein
MPDSKKKSLKKSAKASVFFKIGELPIPRYGTK